MIKRICNFIDKYRLNGGDWICVGYWKKSHIVLSVKNSMRDFKQNCFKPCIIMRNEDFKSGFMIFGCF